MSLNGVADRLNGIAYDINRTAGGVQNVAGGMANIYGAGVNLGVAIGGYGYGWYGYPSYYSSQNPYYRDYYYRTNPNHSSSPTADVLHVGGKIANGGFTAFKQSGAVAGALKELGGGLTAGKLAAVGKAAFGGTIVSGAIGAGTSIIRNTVDVVHGYQSGRRALGNVIADTAGAVVSGAIAATAGGAATLALGGMIAGPALTGAVVVAGIAGYLLADKVYRASGLSRTISDAFAGGRYAF